MGLTPGRLFWKLLLALWISMLLSIVLTIGYLRLTGRVPPPEPSMPSVGPLPVVPLLAGAVAVLLTGAALAWYLTRPVEHLRWALRRVADGHLDTRVHPRMGRRRDEITDLARDFDRMAAQLQRLTQSREVLLHDISHELRSPLTRLQAAIGLQRQDRTQTDTMLARIEGECGRMDALIEQLLTLHRLEAGAPGAQERVDLVELLQVIAEDADFEARSTGRQVCIHAQGSFVADVQGELIYRAFENVIRNAVKYTAPDTEVEIHVQASDGTGQLRITVQDRGPGVPPNQLQAIFEPFIRVQGSESARGTGLGLAIALRALRAHGGQVEASLREGGGLVMAITLPAPSH